MHRSWMLKTMMELGGESMRGLEVPKRQGMDLEVAPLRCQIVASYYGWWTAPGTMGIESSWLGIDSSWLGVALLAVRLRLESGADVC